MKKKVIWLVLSGGMVLTLLLSACAPAVVEKEKEAAPKEVVTPKEEVVPKEVVVPKEEERFVKWTGTKADGTVVERMVEKPKYGGTLVGYRETDFQTWDQWSRGSHISAALHPTHDRLVTVDFTRTMVGTGEYGLVSYDPPYGITVGRLAESWEIPDDTTKIWHIRQGVHWALDPTSEASRLVGGREVTAADVVAFFRYFFTGYLGNNYPFLSDMKNLEKSIYVSPTDKWAVVMKFQPGLSGGNHVYGAQAHNQIAPPEVYQKYGTPITDWRLDVGSGPFILKDYVTASSVTYAKNPDYWMRDPFFPENQLPYVDAFKILIIPDRSTQMAALRTGQLATLNTVEAEDAESLMKTNPELKWQQTLGSVPVIHFRIDTKPFDDIKVRQALVLAINNQELADQYYGGKAALFSYPIGATSDFSDIYLPLEKMPTEPTLSGSRASVPELYGYHPDKARQLLAEAGYPNGFQTEVLTWSRDVDLLSVIKEYWAKIGVDLKLDLKDPTVYTSMSQRFTYPQMIISDTTLSWPIMSALRPGLVQNRSRIFDDPVIEPLYFEMSRRYYDTAKQKLAVTLPLAEVLPNLPEDIGRLKWPTYVNEQAWMAILPNPYIYTMWQPWLKQFQGELVSFHDTFAYANYAWIDQELKKAMGR